MISYCFSIRTVESKLRCRYYDFLGKVHQALGRTGGQQGYPLEIMIFCLGIHHLWGRTMQRYDDASAIAYADDKKVLQQQHVACKIGEALLKRAPTPHTEHGHQITGSG
jgi:hypothetical protein